MARENEKEVVIIDEMSLVELKKGYAEAAELLEDEDKFEKFLRKLEKRLQVIPALGEGLSHIPVMASLLRSFAKKEYPEVPLGTIIAIISALAYWLSPVDLIPDAIPVLGHTDDAGIVLACLKLVDSDIQEYIAWRDANS